MALPSRFRPGLLLISPLHHLRTIDIVETDDIGFHAVRLGPSVSAQETNSFWRNIKSEPTRYYSNIAMNANRLKHLRSGVLNLGDWVVSRGNRYGPNCRDMFGLQSGGDTSDATKSSKQIEDSPPTFGMPRRAVSMGANEPNGGGWLFDGTISDSSSRTPCIRKGDSD